MSKNIKMIALIMLSVIVLYLGISSLIQKPNNNAAVWGEDKENTWKEIKMQSYLDWDTLKNIVTPNLDFPEVVDGYIPLPNPKNPEGFRCTTENRSALLDLDGDGKAEKELKSRENMVQYDLTYKDGSKLKYQLYVWQNGTKDENDKKVPKWCYQRACFMKGNIEGEEILLIDDNNNGRYNDFTRDAICIGTGTKYAGLLSRFIIIKNKLYEIKVDENGLKVLVKEYKEPTGEIDLIKGLNFPSHLPMVVSLQGTTSQEESKPQDNKPQDNKAPADEPDSIPADQIDKLLPKPQTPTRTQDSSTKTPELSLTVYPKDKAINIPVGNYELQMAVFSKQTRVIKGSSPVAIKIEKGKKTVLEWGAPFKLLLKPYIGNGGTIYTFIAPQKYIAPKLNEQHLDCLFVRIDLPTSVLGKNGEEYFSSPEFKDAQGNCMPDNMISSFDISITAKEPAAGNKTPKGKQINVANEFTSMWKQWDPSGLVSKSPKEWINEFYDCPMYDYLGIVNIKVSTKSAIFGLLTFDGDLEVKK